MRLGYALFISVSLIALVSCSEKFEPTPYTYTKFFTGENSKTWRINLLEQTLNGDVVGRFMENCLKDDRFTFYANSEHSYEAFSGVSKCFDDPAEPDLVVDAWTFSNATAALTIIIPRVSDNSLPYIVREVDDDDLVLEIFFDQENTESVRFYFEAIDED